MRSIYSLIIGFICIFLCKPSGILAAPDYSWGENVSPTVRLRVQELLKGIV